MLILLTGMLFPLLVNAQNYTTVVSYGPHPENSIERQINRGIKSGQLTQDEVRHLRREYAQLNRMKEKAWRNGRMTHRERNRINQAQFEFDRLLDRYLHNHKYVKTRKGYDKNRRHNDDRWDDRDRNYYYGKKGHSH